LEKTGHLYFGPTLRRFPAWISYLPSGPRGSSQIESEEVYESHLGRDSARIRLQEPQVQGS
jgi:hypothetical protein